MKIAATTLGMDAAHTHTEVETQTTGWRPGQGGAEAASDPFGFRLSSLMSATRQTSCVCRSAVAPVLPDQAAPGAGALRSSQDVSPFRAPPEAPSAPGGGAAQSPWRAAATAALNSPGSPWGRLTSTTTRIEEERQWFSAKGEVRTGDGRQIDFSLDWSMERRLEQCASAELPMLSLLIDPLMLQFSPTAPLLDSTAVFDFDLDSNGVAETLSLPGSGCGFLALDRDGDGRITSGRELFGPSSGAGFGELAVLDEDGNGWIDESDPFFDKLLLWTPDGQGGESLRTLREAGVGAISVLHLGTAFRLERGDGAVLGSVKASGLFLTEAGEVRPMHEVDLAAPGFGLGSESLVSSGSGEQAMDRLRAIIDVQRQQLEMLLNGQMGEARRVAMRSSTERRDQTLDWLFRRRDHQDALFGWLEQRAEWGRMAQAVPLAVRPESATAAPSDQGKAAAAGQKELLVGTARPA